MTLSSPLTLTHDPFLGLSILFFRLLDNVRRQTHSVDSLLSISDQPVPKVLLVKRILRLARFVGRRGPVSGRVGGQNFVDEDELSFSVGFRRRKKAKFELGVCENDPSRSGEVGSVGWNGKPRLRRVADRRSN